jgi:hypothetical protein
MNRYSAIHATIASEISNCLNDTPIKSITYSLFITINYIFQENSVISSLASDDNVTTPEEPPTTEAIVLEVEQISKCYPKTLSLCSHLPYNSTTYPNLVGHTSKDAILKDLVAFRELLDAECSHLAQVI